MRYNDILIEYQYKIAAATGEEYFVFKNPTSTQVKNKIKNVWKALYDKESNDMWIWWAYMDHHGAVAGKLGLSEKVEPIFLYDDEMQFYTTSQMNSLIKNSNFIRKITNMYKHIEPSAFRLSSSQEPYEIYLSELIK